MADTFQIIVYIVTCINGLSDMITRKVYPILTAAAAVFGIVLCESSLCKSLCLLTLVTSLFIGDVPGIGGGDIDAFLLTAAAFQLSAVSIVFLASCLAVLYYLGANIIKRMNPANKMACQNEGEAHITGQIQIPFVFCLFASMTLHAL